MTSNGPEEYLPESELYSEADGSAGKTMCQAKTRKGEPCRNKALAGQDFCAMHSSVRNGEEEEDNIPEPHLIENLSDLLSMMHRRFRGEYNVDEHGLDLEVTEQFRPIARWIYRKYWRVQVSGIENVPAEGRALLVANHSGVLPFDGAMVIMAVQEEHPQPRLVRALVLSLFFQLPFTAPWLAKTGQVQASPMNAERLLKNDELTLVFPEGVKGIGKPWSKRYQLARFGRGGFVRVAMKTRAPIIPVSIVGAEEIYPHIVSLKTLASILGLPYFPLTPTFPLLGPLGTIPLPTKWYIHFDAPIPIPEMEFRRSEEPLLVTKISNQVRDTIQKNIYRLLKTRRSIFW
ncbi:MAG: lysophospholipid acyltransferase family protein [Thermodesulfobacteriota bacterium]